MNHLFMFNLSTLIKDHFCINCIWAKSKYMHSTCILSKIIFFNLQIFYPCNYKRECCLDFTKVVLFSSF